MGFDSYSPQSQLMHCSKQSRIDGRHLPAMRDQRLVGQADDQRAALTVASRVTLFGLNALVSRTARMFLRPD